MEFTEICIYTDQKHKDDASAIVQMVANGIYIEDYENLSEEIVRISHVDLIDEELLNKNADEVIIHMYLNGYENPAEKLGYIESRLTELNCPYKIEIKKTKDEDWANNWKQYYKPFEIGKSLIVRPEWESLSDTRGRKALTIEPGLAFGTGMHETTKMCVDLLDLSSPSGKTVLDVGCGSGILSIAALLLGAKSALAIDIDPLAVKVAQKNAGLNNVSITVQQGNLTDTLNADDKFDIVFANIIADAIIALTAEIKSHLADGGIFICSGIIDDRLDDVKIAIQNSGLTLSKINMEKGWAAVLAVR